MDNNFDEVDNRTGGEAFLDLVEKQAMFNYVTGKDPDGLKTCMELERGKQKLKPIFEADELAEKTEKTKNGRNKR